MEASIGGADSTESMECGPVLFAGLADALEEVLLLEHALPLFLGADLKEVAVVIGDFFPLVDRSGRTNYAGGAVIVSAS